MSLRAMLWALHDAPVSDPLSKLVLLAMADAHSEDTDVTFLGVRTIAETVPCDRATVQRHLRILERDQLIVRAENQTPAAYIRADRRPTVYLLTMPGRAVRPRPVLTGPQEQGSRGRNGAAPVRPEPENQEINQAQRDAFVAGQPVGCRTHGTRRPACDPCQRASVGLEQTRPASVKVAEQSAAEARAAMRRR